MVSLISAPACEAPSARWRGHRGQQPLGEVLSGRARPMRNGASPPPCKHCSERARYRQRSRLGPGGRCLSAPLHRPDAMPLGPGRLRRGGAPARCRRSRNGSEPPPHAVSYSSGRTPDDPLLTIPDNILHLTAERVRVTPVMRDVHQLVPYPHPQYH